jgi:hypothetical protein
MKRSGYYNGLCELADIAGRGGDRRLYLNLLLTDWHAKNCGSLETSRLASLSVSWCRLMKRERPCAGYSRPYLDGDHEIFGGAKILQTELLTPTLC